MSADHQIYFVCRTDLGMSAGKLAMQAFHAGTGLLARLPEPVRQAYAEDPTRRAVAVRASSAAKLEKARAAAEAAGLAHHLQIDRGHTEVPPDTPTVLAFGPVRRDDLPKTLYRLQLLKPAPTPTTETEPMSPTRDKRDAAPADLKVGFYTEVRIGRNGMLSVRIDANEQATTLTLQDADDNAMTSYELAGDDLDRLGLLVDRARAERDRRSS